MRSRKVSAELSHNAGGEVFPRRTGSLFVFALGFSDSSNVCVFCTFQAIYFCPGDTLAANSLQTERQMGTESIKSARGAKLTWVDGFWMIPDRSGWRQQDRANKQTRVCFFFYDGWLGRFLENIRSAVFFQHMPHVIFKGHCPQVRRLVTRSKNFWVPPLVPQNKAWQSVWLAAGFKVNFV